MLKLPKHIAIVMDGNGRWAKQKGLPRVAGHRAGIHALRDTVRFCGEMSIEVLTVFAFSTENWSRPSFEVKHLSRLFLEGLTRFIDELHANQVVVRTIGDFTAFGNAIAQQMSHAIVKTQNNKGLVFNIALNYSGRSDIVNATQKIAQLVQQGQLSCNQIDETLFNQYTSLHEVIAPDLLIRTGGEKRISNFLLWQCAYTELYFSDLLWPDFGQEGLRAALQEFALRERRFGKTSEQVK